MAKSARQYVRPTDDDLRVRILEIDDPHGQHGLVNHIPTGVNVVRIVNTYSYIASGSMSFEWLPFGTTNG